MSAVYAAADMAVARAGALTLAELEANELPSILIPFPYAAGDHQRLNAETYAEEGAAIVIGERELSQIDLIDKAVKLIEEGGSNRMRQVLAERKKDKSPAVDLIALDIIALLEDRDKDNH
jgi:UDP-N-acetylglucosamine--N-acetylmuramyl-(pentapeptide) pyrophosphoryl-undecaprenol N-acetylglucosamine transferase